MSFYWDDENLLFEEPQKSSKNYKKFVCVRKLFVTDIPCTETTKRDAIKIFAEYGKIKSIEFYKHTYILVNRQNFELHGCSGHVTYTDAGGAYLAIKDKARLLKTFGIKVVPSDTWKQPMDSCDIISDEILHSSSTPISWLSDDCLLEMFIRLDFTSQINLARISCHYDQLMQTYVYPQHDSMVARLLKTFGIKCLPSDTWKQPTDSCDNIPDEIFHSSTTPISWLNDDCLLEMFIRLDLTSQINMSKVSCHYDQLMQTYVYPHHDSVVFDFSRSSNIANVNIYESEPYLTLGEMREKLLAIGKYVKDVKLICNKKSDSKPKNSTRIIDVFTQLVGNNIQSLTIRGFILFQPMREKFNSIFSLLKRFEWDTDFHVLDEYDLVSLCPNLETLIITDNFGNHLNTKPWPKLINLTVRCWKFYQNPVYTEFFRNNPQIKSLEIFEVALPHTLHSIVQNLKQLEKLTILEIYYGERYASTLACLSNLHSLTTIKLLELSPCTKIYEILQTISTMSQLRNVKITVLRNEVHAKYRYVLDGNIMYHLARSLTNLERFHLSHCIINVDDLIRFIEAAKNLKKLSLLRNEIPMDENLLRSICSIRGGFKTHEHLKLVLDDFNQEFVAEILKQEEAFKVLHVAKKTFNSNKEYRK